MKTLGSYYMVEQILKFVFLSSLRGFDINVNIAAVETDHINTTLQFTLYN